MQTTINGMKWSNTSQVPNALKGFLGNQTAGYLVWIDDKNGNVYELPSREDLKNHANGWYAWGYNGSGPMQLAHAICVYCIGEEKGNDPFVYQAFCREFVSKWGLSWEFPCSDVVDWFLESVFASAPPLEEGDE